MFCIVQPPFQSNFKGTDSGVFKGRIFDGYVFFGGNPSGVAPVEMENLVYTLPETNIAPKKQASPIGK